jgi:Tfp pilus assembly protein PilO
MRKTLGKVPTYALFIAAVVLIAAIVVLMEWKLIRPQRESLAQLQEQIAAEEQVAAQRPQAEAELAKVEVEWIQAQARMEELQRTRSLPVSLYQPIGAMIAMWYEYREDLPRVTKKWIDSTGIILDSSITFPTPDMAPPPTPAGGFIAVPGPSSLTVRGTLQQIQRFYTSLHDYERIVTIGGLQLSGEGEALSAQVPISIYLLVEAPAAATGGGGPGEPAEGPGGGPDEFGMGGPPPGMPGEPGPPADPSLSGPGPDETVDM